MNPTDVPPLEQGYYQIGAKECSCSKWNHKKGLFMFLAYLEMSGKK